MDIDEKPKQSHSRKIIKIVSAVILILLVAFSLLIGYGAYLDLKMTKSTGGSFENQWVKFSYPSNLTIWDLSTNDHVDISIHNGTKLLGSITDDNENINDLSTDGKTNKTTINGREALIGNVVSNDNNTPLETSAYIFLTSNSVLDVELYSDNESVDKSVFSQIMDTLIIKKGNVPLFNTYFGNGISFNYPCTWALSNDTSDTSENIFSDNDVDNSITVFENPSEDSPQFEVQIIPNNGLSDQDAINQAQNGQDIEWVKISNSTTKIDGNTAYKSTFTDNDTNIFTQLMKIQQIFLIKNGNTYYLTFQAPNKDFDKEKQNFDLILNSFKIQ